MLSLQLQQRQRLTQKVNPVLNRHWNKKLRKPFALAPADWLEQGLVTKQIYDHQNAHYGDSVTMYMRDELEQMRRDFSSDHLRSGSFTINGIGTLRDLEWMRDANELGLRGLLYDLATWPTKRAIETMLVTGADAFNSLFRRELKGEDGEIDPTTFLLFESAFKQILPNERKDAISRKQGQYLRRSYDLNRRIVMIHPFAKDNKKDLRWSNALTDDLKALLPPDFPLDNRGVKWGDTNPYSWGELLSPIEEGLNRSVKVIRQKQLRYYHQTYTMLTVVAS